VEYFVHAGDVLPATHPVHKAHPDLFNEELPPEDAVGRK
jgi:hypothetical protein